MTYLPILFFTIAAAGGMTLVTMKYRGKGMPISLAIAHGIFAATGLVILLVNVIMDTSNTLMNISPALFAAAALGGSTVFSFHIRKRPMPDKLIIIHGSGAVISFIPLLLAAFK